MTSGSNNFNTFPENQLTTFRAFKQYYEILHCCSDFFDRSAGTVSSFSQKCQYRHTLSPDFHAAGQYSGRPHVLPLSVLYFLRDCTSGFSLPLELPEHVLLILQNMLL